MKSEREAWDYVDTKDRKITMKQSNLILRGVIVAIACVAIVFIVYISYLHSVIIPLKVENTDPSSASNPIYDVYNNVTDEKVCREINNRGGRNACYSKLGLNLKDDSICEKINDQITMKDCYWDIATTIDDPEICKKILELDFVQKPDKDMNLKPQLFYDTCIIGLFLKGGDLSLCDYLPEKPAKDGSPMAYKSNCQIIMKKLNNGEMKLKKKSPGVKPPKVRIP